MFIEDILDKSATNFTIKFNTFDGKIIYSIHNQQLLGNKLTEKQGTLIVSILKKYRNQISQALNKDISVFLENPVFKHEFRSTNLSKKINIIDHPEWKKAIAVEFPYNEEIINKIKSYKPKFFRSVWRHDEKQWIFTLDEHNIDFLTILGEEFNFTFSDEFFEYSTQVKKIKETLENIVPVLTIENNLPMLKNISKFVPPLNTTDCVEAIFQARKFGIYHWDESVDEYLLQSNIPVTLKNFLKQDPGQAYSFNINNHSLDEIFSIVKYLSPSIFIMPGGSELEKLITTYDFLINNNVASNEISVMFRLSTETDKKFNEFIRERKLNNPLTDKTKIIIIGTKMPKPVVQSEIKIHSVFNFGFGGVHYSLRNFVKNQENLVYITEKNLQQEINFANL